MKFRRRALLISCVLTLAPIVLPRAVVHAAGISWPPSQALPHFPQATHLDVVDTMAPTTCPGGCSGDDRLLLATLEGVIGRTQPRIYILEQLNDIQSDQNNQWLAYLNTLGVSTTMGVTEDQILRRYDQSTGDGEIKGFIVYDPALRDTINIATTLAGLDDGVVASPDVGARLAAAPYNMRQLDDLRGRFPDAMTAYNWAHDNIWPRVSHSLIMGLDPGASYGFLHDYAAGMPAMVVWLDSTQPAQHDVFERFLSEMPADSAYLGWFPNSVGGEQAGIQQTSQHAVYAVATDYAANLSAFSGAAAPLSPPAATTPPPLSNRVYVSFTMTDGDNVQYDQHLMRQRWDDAARGQVPISWSLQPLLLDAAPAVLSYYQRTATAQDDLIAGPSGAGYMFPGSWPHDALSTFTQTSGRYMRAAGLRSLMVYNAPAPGQLPDAAAQAYLQGVNPNGIEGDWSSSGVTTTALDGSTTPYVRGVLDCGASLNQSIASMSRGWNGQSPLFLSLGVFPWCGGPGDILSAAHALGPQYSVVSADDLFSLEREYLSTGSYWLVAADGGIFSFGAAQFFGSTGGMRLNQPIVGMAPTPDRRGYWLVASDGGIFTFGDAQFFGSEGDKPLNQPIVGMAPTADGGGYWLVARDGGIFAFGDAQFLGSEGGRPLNQPIVGMASTPDGRGYWLAASDGGIFTFGDAQFFGSEGGKRLNRPVTGAAATPSGDGYWLVASDGGIFTFGDAQFFGSEGGKPLNQPVNGMMATGTGRGYWLVASDGGIFTFGDAAFHGSMGGHPLNRPVVGMSIG